MTATTEQKFEELRRAYEELQKQHDTALAELQVRASPVAQDRDNGLDATIGAEADRDFGTLKTENEELRAAQAAGLEVLQAMVASPGDTQPVFDLIAQSAAKLCNVPHAVFAKFDGTLIHVVTYTGMDPATAEVLLRQFPRPPGQDIALGRAILNGRIEQIEDITDPRRRFTPPPGQRSVLAVPLLRDGVPLGAIAIGRPARGSFPKNQITLLQTFAEQAVIAITSAETYRALQERTAALAHRNSEYGERIEQQAATIDVLKVMSASPDDALPVFRLIVERARAFFEADGASLALLHDDMLHLQAYDGSFRPDYAAGFPRQLSRTTMFGRAILARGVVEMPDVSLDPDDYARGTPKQVQHAIIAVPLLRAGVPLGAIAIGRRSAGKFSAAEVELLKTFAEQAVIAIGSAETYRALQTRTSELQESLEYQTATSDILSAISRSTFDLQPVLAKVAETAARLCIADQAAIFLVQGNTARLATNFGFPPEYQANVEQRGALPILRDSPSVGYRSLAERRVVHIHDVAAVPGYPETSVILGKQRTSLGIPLLREGEAIGLIMLARQRVEPFSERQLDLVSTFADQAVIAIENTRLLTEQREALEQQTATAEVLQVINASPGNLTPVFDVMLEKALKLCEADVGSFWSSDGRSFTVVASTSGDDIGQTVPRVPGTSLDRIARGDNVVQIEDVTEHAEYQSGLAHERTRRAGTRTALAVALRKDNALVGAITTGRREVKLFRENQIALLRNFADQAVIAMENARLINETREALEQQTATAEILRVINASPGNLTPVFDIILEKAQSVCGVDHAALELYDGEYMRAISVHGASDKFAETLRQGYRASDSPASQALLEGRPFVEIADASRIDHIAFRTAAATDGIGTVLFVPLRRNTALLGMIAAARRRIQPFSTKEISLLQNFAAQAVVAIENARLLAETRESLDQQIATAEVLQIINASPGNLKPVFDAVLEKALRLCAASFGTLLTVEGERLERVALLGVPPAFAMWGHQNPLTKDAALISRGFHTRKPVQAVDVLTDPFLANTPSVRDALVNLGGVRALLQVPLLKDGAVRGFIGIFRREPGAFPEKQVALLEGFAAQAVIAMDNARLLTEQREALERQTATAEVLQVINSSPGDLMPVFDAILEKAHNLCAVSHGSLHLFDGAEGRAVAVRGLSDIYAGQARQGYRLSDSPAARQLLSGARFAQILDASNEEFPLMRNAAEIEGIRTALFVPLRKDAVLLGMIVSSRREVRPFSDKEVALLENFAAQAVIAMENARLMNEQREALEQQTATAEVLQVINSSPGNLVPVFDAILEKAHRLCGATVGSLFLYEGGLLRAVATQGFPELYETLLLQPFSPGPGHQALINGERLLHIPDIQALELGFGAAERRRFLVQLGLHTFLLVPLRKDGLLLGLITAARGEIRLFSGKEISLLENFAAQAVVAMENARLLNEVRQRQEELRITFENMGDAVAMFDETQHLVAWNGKFQEIFDLPDVLLEQHRTYEEHLQFLAERGYFGSNVDTGKQIHTLVATTGQSYGYERTLPDGRVIEIRRNPVPDGGFVLIFSDITERKRSEEEIRAARDAAEAAYSDLKTAQASLIQAEKMASLGQLTAGIAHEIKNPLNFVNNFASLSVDLLDELKQTAAPGLALLDDSRRAEVDDLANTLASNLGKINEHGRRADGIVRSMLEHSRGSSGERRPVDLNALVDEALNLAYHGARAQDQNFNITLQRELGEAIAPITLAPQDVTRVLLNLFSNGFYAAQERARTMPGFEPSLRVSTRELDDAVEIRVRDNGIGIPPEIKDRLFQPFFTTKPPGDGTGLGLSMSYDIVTQQHGGSISVDSKAGEYSEFTIRLPRYG